MITPSVQHLLLALLAALIPFTAACTPQGQTPKAGVRQKTSSAFATLSFFINLDGRDIPDFSLTVEEFAIRSGDAWTVLIDRPRHLDSRRARQFFLSRTQIDRGRYDAVRLRLGDVTLNGQPLTVDRTEKILSLPPLAGLNHNPSQALFLSLDVRTAFQGRNRFQPAFRILPQDLNFSRDLLFIACPEIDTVYILRTDTNTINAAIGVDGGPLHTALLPGRRELLVLSRDQPTITRIDLTTGTQRDRWPVPLISRPVDFVLSPDGQHLYIIGDRNLLVSLEPLTGTLTGRTRLGDGLDDIVLLGPTGRQLAVASSRTQEIFLVDTATLAIQASIPTLPDPRGMAASENALYIAEQGGGAIARYDLTSGAISRRHLPGRPGRLAVDRRFLYVAAGKGITVYRQDSLAWVQRIDTGGNTGELALDDERLWLYAADRAQQGIAVIDITARRRVSFVNLATPPTGLVLLGRPLPD